MSKELYSQFSNYGIVPVIQINKVEDAVPLAKALIDGGLPVAEVTFRTEAAEEAIKLMSDAYPEMIIGAGTVLTVEQVDAAVKAGSQFIVSPGLNPKIVKYCQSINVPILPGTANPSDLEAAIELGLDTVKFFPAEVNGGLPAIKAMSAPYGQLKFMPTGGVNEDNLNEYLGFDKILACGGTWMVKSDLIDSKNFEEITNLTKKAVAKMLDIKLAHIGINNDDNNYANNIELFKNFTLEGSRETSKSTFVGDVELMDSVYNGEKGHLGYSCSNIERAIFYLEKNGIEFDYDTAVYENDKITFIYAKDSIAGFAVHLIRK